MNEERDNIDPKKAYDEGGISTREFYHKKDLNYAESCAIKYIVRHLEKNGKEDLEKAKNNIEFLIDNYGWIYGEK